MVERAANGHQISPNVAMQAAWSATGTSMPRLSPLLLALCLGCGPADSPPSAASSPEPVAEPGVAEPGVADPGVAEPRAERAGAEDAERADALVDEAMAGLPDDLSAEERAMMEEGMRGFASALVEHEAAEDERAAIARTQGCVDAVMARHYGPVDRRDNQRAIAEQLVAVGVRQALMAGDDPCSCDAPESAACAALVNRVAAR